MSFEGNYHDALKRVVALEQERDDYILKQKVWEEANDELRSEHIKLNRRIEEQRVELDYLRSKFPVIIGG